MDIDEQQNLLITCGRQIAPYLRKEVEEFGLTVKSQHSTGIELSASLKEAIKLTILY